MKIFKVELKRRKISLLHLAAILGLLTFSWLQTAEAQTTTFAQFNQTSNQNGFFFDNRGDNAPPSPSGSLFTPAGGTPVEFTYLNIPGLDPSLQGNQCARIFVDSITTQPAVPGAPPNGIRQNFNQVVIQILRCFPAPVGGGSRNNLLTVQVTSGAPAIFGNIAGESASFVASTPSENVTFTSDFLDFSGTTARNFALSFSSVIPALALGANGILADFSAAGTGTFASTPRPTICCLTTSASVSVAGRLITPSGRGLNNAIVTLTEADGTVHTTRTTAFGYYRFADLSVGQTITINVASKRYSFEPMVWNLVDEIQDLNLYLADSR
ncbi:MAG: carboxypeptidase-like regulatory domain-containing protein [Acidobacteriota bacterium]|nr:carboxypeptidase-like regulatory domain-containing protein [Acidobacteriota bacterium]